MIRLGMCEAVFLRRINCFVVLVNFLKGSIEL